MKKPIAIVCLSLLTSVLLAQPIPRDGLVGWWRGNGDAQDSAGKHDGTLPFGMNYSPGPNGLAFDFDGASRSRVSVPDSPDFRLTKALTIAAWIYPRQSGGYVFFYGDDRPGLDPYKIDLSDGCVRFQITDAANQTVGIESPVQFNQWQHIAATFGRHGRMQLFINGKLAAATNTTLIPLDKLDPASTPAIGIGNTGGTQYQFPFNGLIADVALYSRALTARQIRSICQPGTMSRLSLPMMPAPEGLTINQAHYDGLLSATEARWTLNIDAVAANQGESSAPLLEGDIAILPPTLPDSLNIVRTGSIYTLVASHPGHFKFSVHFISRADRVALWNSTSFIGPEATISSLTAQATGADTEIQLVEGATLEVARTNGASCLTGFLGEARAVSLRWQPKLAEVTHKALLMVDSTLSAHVTPGVINYTNEFHCQIVQGSVSELALDLPAAQTLTRLEGEQIRDWRLSAHGNRQTLTIDFIKPLDNDYELTACTEQSIDGTTGSPILDPPQPMNVDHESGSLVVSADNTVVNITAPAGLRQVNAPGNALAAYEFDARPVALALKLAAVEPELNVADRVNAQLEEARLVVSHHLVLDVQKAGIYTLELTPQPGFVVADVRGQGIEDWNSSDGKIHVNFSDRVLGADSIDVQLEQSLKKFPDTITLAPLFVTGAANQTANIGAVAAPGIRLRTGSLSGLREIPVDRLPDRSNEILAYTADGPQWALAVATERLAPHVVADVFNLVTIGDGTVGGSATIRYGLVNQGVQEFKVRVPDACKNVEFTGPNIRSKEFSKGIWTIGLQDKVWGGYTLVVTYDYSFDSTGANLPVAGVHAENVERETGSIAMTTAANLQINPGTI
ncbi:MAG TPA: LamG domain-containing protein, partial [Verrucomicrobiae bacterium]|nr:LamG domain-containing protein [Verrucomicrobiae bacterium]